MTSRIEWPLRWVVVWALLLAAVTANTVQVDRAPPQAEAQVAVLAGPAASRQVAGSPTPELRTATVRREDPRGDPVRVIIPAIDVDADLVGLGLNTDGSMEVPDFGLAGWYTEGPKPGQAGPAVIAAHVDSRTGPDVFHRLGDLAIGDEIHVVYDGGDTVTFFANSSQQTRKEELPVADIWPTTDERLLTLITCGGEFDRGAGHYRDNLIVYTSLVRPQRAEGRPLV